MLKDFDYGWSEDEREWRLRAACVGLGDMMFPNGYPAETRAAVAVCQDCPVTRECAAFAVETGTKSGVWGGRSRVRVRISGHSS
jgi:hypothetical protein